MNDIGLGIKMTWLLLFLVNVFATRLAHEQTFLLPYHTRCKPGPSYVNETGLAITKTKRWKGY